MPNNSMVAGVINRADVGMIQGGRGPRLSLPDMPTAEAGEVFELLACGRQYCVQEELDDARTPCFEPEPLARAKSRHQRRCARKGAIITLSAWRTKGDHRVYQLWPKHYSRWR